MEKTAYLSHFFHAMNYIISVLYNLYYPCFEWGSRGRWFDSSHSDHLSEVQKTACFLDFLLLWRLSQSADHDPKIPSI